MSKKFEIINNKWIREIKPNAEDNKGVFFADWR